jgi:hypothetical protein
MKIKAWLLLLFLLQVVRADSQQVVDKPLEKKITLTVENEAVCNVLKLIENQVKLSFSYNSQLFDGTKRISVSFKEKKITEVISVLFDNKILCRVAGKYIILYRNAQLNNMSSVSAEKIVVLKDPVKKEALRKETVKKEVMEAIAVYDLLKENVNTIHQNDSSVSTISVIPDSTGILKNNNLFSVPTLVLINNDSTILMLNNPDSTHAPR